MSDRNRSRLDKFEKRRKNTKLMSYLLIAAGVLIVILIGTFVFSDSEASKEREQASTGIKNDQPSQDAKLKAERESIEEKKDVEAKENEEKQKQDKKNEEDNNEDSEKDKNKVEEDEKDKKVKTKKVESSDNNVSEAYTGNWKPVDTEQSGSHTTNYNKGSQDWIEMHKAIESATGLTSMTTWWVERAGDQKVQATVSNKSDQSEIYRVHLKWVKDKGWKPTKVEVLKKNDQKYRFR